MATSTAAERQAFSKRLIKACDEKREIPPLHYGRQASIANMMGVAREAVHAWFNGVTLPNNRNCIKLAKLLGVDVAWLLFGVTRPVTSSRAGTDGAARSIDRLTTGTTLARSILDLAGLETVDVPSNSFKTDRISFYARVDQSKMYAICVVVAELVHGPSLSFGVLVPAEDQGTIVVLLMRGLVPALVKLERHIIRDVSPALKGVHPITLTPLAGGNFRMGKYEVPPLRNLMDLRYS